MVRARLSDARHFWLTDLHHLPDYKDKAEKPLDQRLAKLEALGIVFHEKLGTQAERIDRIESLAREIAPQVGADVELAARAARLAKADLVTEMVGEFPELQGLMGRYYAAAQGEEPSVAAAVEEHYKPQGPNDRAPDSPVSIAVALADKLDTLGAFWAIDEKPTGSKDPYALRRAALGVIRIVLENGLRLPLSPPLNAAVWGALLDVEFAREDEAGAVVQSLEKRGFPKGPELEAVVGAVSRATRRAEVPDDARLKAITGSLLAFFADRLKIYLRDKGARYDLIDAVFALPGQDDLLTIVWRVEALGRLLDTEDGQNLLTGYRRAANILRAEEKTRRRGRLRRRARPVRPRAQGGEGPRRRTRRGGSGGARTDRTGGLRGRDAGARELARAGRRLLPRRDRQRRRSGAPPQPPAAARRVAGGGARGRGFLQGGGVAWRPAPP